LPVNNQKYVKITIIRDLIIIEQIVTAKAIVTAKKYPTCIFNEINLFVSSYSKFNSSYAEKTPIIIL